MKTDYDLNEDDRFKENREVMKLKRMYFESCGSSCR